jgi:uncharacterized BrkB/YihY/UPF0761 family membrane protein
VASINADTGTIEDHVFLDQRLDQRDQATRGERMLNVAAYTRRMIFRLLAPMWQRIHRIIGAIDRFYWGRGIAYDVPAMTYYLLLSLVPFALGLSAIATVVLHQYVSNAELARNINHYVPASAGPEVLSLLTRTRHHTPALLGTAVLSMLWTMSNAIGVIERGLRRQLSCPPARHPLFHKLRQFALGGVLALLFIAAIAIGTAAGGVFSLLHISAALVPIGFFFFNTIGTVVIIAVIFQFLVRPALSWFSAFIGATFAGIGLQLLPLVLGAYVSTVTRLAAEQIFLVVAGLLFGFFWMSLLLLVGAGFAAKDQQRRQSPSNVKPASAADSLSPAPIDLDSSPH